MERVFEMVKKNVGKHLQYRVKEYLEDDAKDFQEGTLVLVFLYNKGRVNQARKTTTAWSLPFKIEKRISSTVFELESLNWSETPIKMIRGLSSLKLYKQGKTDFSEERGEYEPKDFMANHEFEEITSDEEEVASGTGYLTQDSQERIRLRSGTWIRRDTLNKTTSQTEEYGGQNMENDISLAEDTADLTINDNEQRSNEQQELATTQNADELGELNAYKDNQTNTRSQKTAIPRIQLGAKGRNCAATKCIEMTEEKNAHYTNCIACNRQFHIRCVGFTERRASNQSYLCPKCESTLR